MCEYCEGKPLALKDYDLGVMGRQRVYLEIRDGSMWMGLENISKESTLEQFGETQIRMTYCPMCGRKIC